MTAHGAPPSECARPAPVPPPDTDDPVLWLADARRLSSTGLARRIRESSGVTNPEIARHIDLPRNTTRRWERGERRPHGEGAIRWAKILRRLERETAGAIGGAA